VTILIKTSWKIKEDKTKVMKFRKGGRLSKNDVLYCNGSKLEFVNMYKYLGIIMQPSGIAFGKHISERARLALLATFSITKLNLLSVHTALRLFDLKVAPVATYAINLIWPHLTLSDLRKLEAIKSMFFKRVSRLVYKLAQVNYFVSDIKGKFNLPDTPAYLSFLQERDNKSLDIDFEFYYTDAMLDSFWTKPNFSQRHVYTRFAIHGFHFHLCKTSAFHDCYLSCVCKYCHKLCGLYHVLRCTMHPFKSFAQLASHSSL
jgi:hypothetical protein